jgi:tetratricopeptide (TPR) repeat protein
VSEQEPGSVDLPDPERIEELYERAQAMAPEHRTEFLAEACGSDALLHAELTSLLAHTQPAELFFAELSGAIVSPAVGHSVGHYRLVGILGTGGMGTVYRAHDTRLDRPVALKFLAPYLSAHPEARERFLIEARAAAALEHPNVCSIHEIGDAADSLPFIAMTCYEGETLKERLSRGPVPPAEAATIVIQIARGLRAAHARGIVHRDVKPGNILLGTDGTVRLLDFGLAKVADVSVTVPGVTAGTVAYMSPEQARGDPVDHLTDIWSVGVVFYEMLAGIRPFRGGNDRAVIQAILHDQPDLGHGRLRDASPSSLRIIERLLRKAPADRYENTAELLGDLERTAPGSSIGAISPWIRSRSRMFAVRVGVVGLLAAVALLALLRPGHRSGALIPDAVPALQSHTIAVLPFTVRGDGLAVWREGMVDLLSIGLDGVAGIRAIDSRTLLAAWHQEIRDETAADLARALGVARRTHARYALVGSVVGAEPRIRIAANVYDAESARAVGAVQVEGPSDSVLALADRLGMQTLGVILDKDAGHVPAVDLAAITTSSLIALKFYLEGDDHYRRSEFSAASAAWERAVHADTLFALGYLGLADAYAWNDGFDLFKNNLARAKLLAARLPARERAKVQMRWARYAQAPEAFATVQEVIRQYPDAADAWYELGETYFHHDVAVMAGPEEALAAFRKAVELLPTMAPYRAHLVDLAFMWQPDSARITSEVEAYARLAPAEPRTHVSRIALALAFGDGAARDSARAVVGTLDSESAAELYDLLQHPRFAEVRRLIFPAVASRMDGRRKVELTRERLMNLGFMDGRLREALAILSDPVTPPGFRFCGLLYFSARDLPVPQSMLQQERVAALADSSLSTSVSGLQCAADYATRFGDWSQHAALVARARSMAAQAAATGDSGLARDWQRAGRAAEAYGLWRHGRKAEALRGFESTLAGDRGQESLWYVGLLARDLGKLEEAEQAFRALWTQRDGAPARLQLARILERTGRPAEARQAYQFVADAWRSADPELQPQVAEAREALARLSRAGS